MTPETQIPGVYIEEVPSGARPISSVATSIAAFVGQVPEAEPCQVIRLAAASELEELFGDSPESSPLVPVLRSFFANGGQRALVAPVADGSATAMEGGLATLAEERWNLLCLPPAPDAAATGGGLAGLGAAGVAALAAFCEERRAFLILDADPDWSDRQSALAGRAALGSDLRNAALYFPWLELPGGAGSVPPSGAVAGIYARTDAAQGVWKAPAGIEAALQGFTDLSVDLNEAEGGQLNQAGVCCLRRFAGAGPLVWGARTLSSDPEWKYIPTRRLFLFLEESIERGTRWAVFEPNNHSLWNELQRSVESFLHSLWRDGAFQGAKAEEAFFVRCGPETTTAADVGAGVANLELGVAPLRPAEFLTLRLAVPAGGGPASGSDVRRSLRDLELASQEVRAGGFEERRGRPALLALFAGPSGTGKTFAARSLASRLRRPLYRIDLAEMLGSKYIGETEKNLARIFTAAEHAHAILFFDEADALFGKRSRVRDTHDRFANIEVSYLLKQLEGHSGLVLMATGRAKAIDSAFLRRFRFLIRFDRP